MANTVKSFKELTPDLQAFAGGKGGMLAQMFQDGYPVPEGFVVLPSAFQEEKLNNEAWNEIHAYVKSRHIRKTEKYTF